MYETRDLSATEMEIGHALSEAGWKAHRCMDAWTAFEKDGRSITVNWDAAGQIDSVEGLTVAELLRLLAPESYSHCRRCGTEYETPDKPQCECAGDPPVDKTSPEHADWLTRVWAFRFDRHRSGRAV